MEISAAIPVARASQQAAASLLASKPAPPDANAKLKESCRQFEAVLWRSVLEKSRSSQSDGEEAGGLESGDKTGTYQYFVNNNLANAVTGLPSSFSSVLYSQLSSHLKTGPGQNNPS